MILGISSFVSNFLWGGLVDVFSVNSTVDGWVPKVINYHHLFLVPFGISLLAAILLALFFHSSEAESNTLDARDELRLATS